MNIKARINARKVVLSFIYQHCFFDNLQNQSSVAVESLFIDNIFKTDNEKFDEAKKLFSKDIEHYQKLSVDQESLTAFVEKFFDEWTKEEVDFDYVYQLAQNFEKYIGEIETMVDKYTESFKYSQMDLIDKSLFLLGYTERKVLETPKEVLINELIELGKRYSDDGAPKLLNGIMHKILNSVV